MIRTRKVQARRTSAGRQMQKHLHKSRLTQTPKSPEKWTNISTKKYISQKKSPNGVAAVISVHCHTIFVDFAITLVIFVHKTTFSHVWPHWRVIIYSMIEFVSHYSAACRWNIPNLNDVVGAEYNDRYENVIHLTVDDPTMKYHKKGYRIHSYKRLLPRGAVKKHNGSYVASPEFVFLQLASELDIHRLILLGLQMCSHPVGNGEQSVTTKQRLESFLKNTTGHYGQKKAKLALRYVENGSASIMESMVYMILVLPHTLGGYGLSGMCFNYKIQLNTRAKQELDQSKCYMDLYFKEAKVAVEYDSFAYHNTPLAQGKDQLRASALKQQGITVAHLTTIQLYDKDKFEKFAVKLASSMRKRIRIRAKDFEVMREHLRKLLPTRDYRKE